jgi:hypothetical protein
VWACELDLSILAPSATIGGVVYEGAITLG